MGEHGYVRSSSATRITTGIPVMDSSRNEFNRSPVPRPWSTGLFDCFDDCGTCCLTFWCPCVTFGRIAVIVDQGSPSSCIECGALYLLIMCLTGCSCLYSCLYRSKLREKYFLEESPCCDLCVQIFCENCSLCQQYRELKNHDFDMTTGVQGNVERQNRTVFSVAPTVEGRMYR